MNKNLQTRYFISYSGIKLPLNLVNQLDSTDNRNTYYRAQYDENERLLICEKVVYGEVELTHQYEYHANGQLKSAQITNEDDEQQTLNFDNEGNPG